MLCARVDDLAPKPESEEAGRGLGFRIQASQAWGFGFAWRLSSLCRSTWMYGLWGLQLRSLRVVGGQNSLQVRVSRSTLKVPGTL